MPKRTFEQMSVVATGVQSFFDRFGKRRRYDDESPSMAQWRCNLTGLSQVQNLYFVAYRESIHVYTPHFPSQAIPKEPVLVFTSISSVNGLPGYIDAAHPHAINNLVIEYLGNDEVIAVSRDDGDVDVFLVRHIVQAIERRAETGNTIGTTADEIRPMFQTNVERSGWGIAIHSQARILATSSNSHEVRIYKFGLVTADDDESPDESPPVDEDALLDNGSGADSKAQAHSSRKQDVTLHVINGNTNIPHIAFCNTGDDAEGRWLLTTDIGGFCRVMDLRESASSQTFRFGRSFARPDYGGFDRLNAGWMIMFLNRRSFKPEPSMNAALGMHEQESLPSSRDNARIWDISKTASSRSDQPFILHRPSKHQSADRPPLDIRSPSGQSETSSVVESHDESTRPSTASEAQDALEIEIDLETEDYDNELEDDDGEGGVDIEVEHDLDDEMTVPRESIDRSESEEDWDWQPSTVDDMIDPDDEGTEDTIAFNSFYNGDSVCGNEPRFARLGSEGSLCDDLPCPILHASMRNIYLLQPSNQQITPGPWIPPMVGVAAPLRQAIQQDFQSLQMFERLNMSAQIPALGIVVLASQKGRALVLSLTKLDADADYPPGTRDMAQKNTTYGMRVECILPFSSQEKQNQRPFAPLHGLAVGPMQGFEDVKEGEKRWRVMLMYQDHSVLSYKISRKGQSRDSGVDVGTLVV